MSVATTAPNGSAAPPVATDINTPRLYQSELFEECKARKNIIIRSDTGTGKTLVALLLIRWLASQPRPLDDEGKPEHAIQAFMVPTRALVEQQLHMVETRTTLRCRGVTGQEAPELWHKGEWVDVLENLDVLVCTAAVFLDVLSRGFWPLDRVSLVIFDEAHHGRKKHPYAQIMTDHYKRLRDQGETQLPRILGLTASPVWNFNGVEKAIKDINDLQECLCSKLYEVRLSRDDLDHHTTRPAEKLLYFESSLRRDQTVIEQWQALDLVGDDLVRHDDHDKYLSTLRRLSHDMGTYAQLFYVTFILNRLLSTSDDIPPVRRETLAIQLSAWHARLDASPHAPAQDLSPKIVSLAQCLAAYRPTEGGKRFLGIVFVERRIDAQLIKQVLEKHEALADWIRPVSLVGHGVKHDENGMDSKAQNRAVTAFRCGEYNLAVATNVAEEGLDFPACRLVVRFDEIQTYKGYLQARGRARAQSSDYVIFVNRGESGTKLTRWRESECVDRLFEPPDADREPKRSALRDHILDQSDNESMSSDESIDTPRFIIPLADGNESVLTYVASPGLLSDTCQLLPHDPFMPIPRPTYQLEVTADGFVSTVTLPTMSELPPDGRVFRGDTMPTKKAAKRSAAYEACKKLLEVDVLTKHLLPKREDLNISPTDADGNPLSTVEIAETVDGLCWNPYGNVSREGGVLHRVSLENFGNEGQTFEFGLVCGEELPSCEDLVLFDHNRDNAKIVVKVVESGPLVWPDGQRGEHLEHLNNFTRLGIQVCVSRRGYEGELLFLVAPLVEGRLDVDWELMRKPTEEVLAVDECLELPYVVVPIRALRTRLLVPKEACNNVILRAPLSELPEWEGMGKFRRSIVRSKLTSLDHWYAVALELKFDCTIRPLLYLDSVPDAQNNLVPSPSDATPFAAQRCLLPVSACRRSRLPLDMWRVFTMLPSLSRLLHDATQAQRLMEACGVEVYDRTLVIQALTPPGVNIGYDYQTLETIGDAFLKLATSVHLYTTRVDRGEGTLSVLRSRSIDNAYLRGKAVETADTADWVLGQTFRTERFRAAHLENGRVIEDGRIKRKVARRVLCDVIESTLGAVYLAGGVESGLALGYSYGLCFGGIEPWAEREFERPERLHASGAAHVKLQECLGYTFKDPRLLVQALTHRSANSFFTGCYEREEWMGDAVLDMWIIERLYSRFPTVTAEQLTFLRASVVNNGSLGFLAMRKLELQKTITHNASTLESEYKRAQTEVACFEQVEDFFKDPSNAFTAYEPPKILGDALEAIFGAVFVDSSFDLAITYAVIDKVFVEVLPVLKQGAPRDPLSRMLHSRDHHFCVHLDRTTSIEFEEDETGAQTTRVHSCTIAFHGVVIGSGKHATSASVAEQRAARMAMDLLDETGWAACGCLDAKRARDDEIKSERKRQEKAAKEAAAKEKGEEEEAKTEAEAKEGTPVVTGSSSEEEGTPAPPESTPIEEDDDDDGTATIVGDPQTLGGLWRGVKRVRSEESNSQAPRAGPSDRRGGQAEGGE